MKNFILIALFALAQFFTVYAQEDAEGCKDHPLLTRLENFYISGCEENFNELVFRTNTSKSETKEGNLFYIYYRYNSDAGVKAKSALQVIRNYEVAITKSGGKLLYKNTNVLEDVLEATYYLSTREKEYWIQLTSFAGTENAVEAYVLNVLEMEAMKQVVSASEMYEAINQAGFVSLYINFETGKSEIKAESNTIVDQIYEMLRQNTDLKISIEGHTDNVGSEQSNQSLSESRAKAVLNALITKGVNASRLSSKGWGQNKPVADNNTEDGRAKNRRVEIVKQ